MASTSPQVRIKARIAEYPPAEPAAARAHFEAKLGFETDPSDVRFDLDNAPGSCVVVDCRSPDSFAKGHVPGAVNIPYRTMNEQTTSRLSKSTPIVAYCTSVSCNASAKGALRLASLGFRVKEMVGGIEAWKAEGYPVATGPQ
jgi:rhodanese-related sulfurtransferase